MNPWSYVATIPGGANSLYNWKLNFGELEYFKLFQKRYLKSKGIKCEVVQCKENCGAQCSRRVVEHEGGEIKLICNEHGPSLDANFEDIFIHEINWQVLGNDICQYLDIHDTHFTKFEQYPYTWQIGNVITKSKIKLPVFLSHTINQNAFLEFIKELVLIGKKPFVIVTISSFVKTFRSNEILSNNESYHFSLNEFASVDNMGKLDFDTSLMLELRKIINGSSNELSFDLPENIFRKKGQKWEVRYKNGEIFHLDDTNGARYIAMLLTSPRKPIPAILLYTDGSQEEEGTLLTTQRGIPLGDERYLTDLKKKIRELQEKYEEFESIGDFDRCEEVEEQINQLKDIVKSMVGKNGNITQAGDPKRRVRDAVSKSIKRVFSALETEKQSNILNHLMSSIRMGNEFIYSPLTDTEWITN